MVLKLGPGSPQKIEETGFVEDVDYAMGMGALFWGLLTPGKESDGLMSNSTPSLLMFLLKVKAPRRIDHRAWCWVGRQWSFFRGVLR